MNQHGWQCPDESAAECEMSEFLYSLVRLLKPKLVVETGCYLAHSTVLMAQAVCDNKQGFLVSYDTNPTYVMAARLKTKNLPCEIKHCSSLDLPELAKADLVFSDSDYKFRPAEIGRAKKGAIVVVHDTKIFYDTNLPPLEGIVEDLGGITFQTYRGFGILKKKA